MSHTTSPADGLTVYLLEALTKTEVRFLSARYRSKLAVHSVSFCDKTVGVLFDDYRSLVPHVTATCKSAFYHLLIGEHCADWRQCDF